MWGKGKEAVVLGTQAVREAERYCERQMLAFEERMRREGWTLVARLDRFLMVWKKGERFHMTAPGVDRPIE